MLKRLGTRKLLLLSFLTTINLMHLLTFFVTPKITGEVGMGLINLQLSFDKNRAMELIASWGEHGRVAFNQLIIIDYIYPISYVCLLISLLALQMPQQQLSKLQINLLRLPILAGLLDWLENSMEIIFINFPHSFSEQLFFTHSLVASAKWLIILFTLINIIKLFITKKRPTY